MGSKKNVWFKSILAGIAIGLGCIAYLSVDNKYIGAFLFSIGLFTICSKGWTLFTGKLCSSKDALELFIIWIGNWLGALLMATIYAVISNNNWETLCANKISHTPLVWLLSGMLCELCIYIAVIGYRQFASSLGQYLAIILGVMVFILSGFEHCVADMFYSSIAIINQQNIWSYVALVLFATCGNILGACILRILDHD